MHYRVYFVDHIKADSSVTYHSTLQDALDQMREIVARVMETPWPLRVTKASPYQTLVWNEMGNKELMASISVQSSGYGNVPGAPARRQRQPQGRRDARRHEQSSVGERSSVAERSA